MFELKTHTRFVYFLYVSLRCRPLLSPESKPVNRLWDSLYKQFWWPLKICCKHCDKMLQQNGGGKSRPHWIRAVLVGDQHHIIQVVTTVCLLTVAPWDLQEMVLTDLVQRDLLSLIHMLQAHCKQLVLTGCGRHSRWWTRHSWCRASRIELKIALRTMSRYCCCWEWWWEPASRWPAKSSLPISLGRWRWSARWSYSELQSLLAPAWGPGTELNRKRNKCQPVCRTAHDFVQSSINLKSKCTFLSTKQWICGCLYCLYSIWISVLRTLTCPCKQCELNLRLIRITYDYFGLLLITYFLHDQQLLSNQCLKQK